MPASNINWGQEEFPYLISTTPLYLERSTDKAWAGVPQQYVPVTCVDKSPRKGVVLEHKMESITKLELAWFTELIPNT